MQKKDELAATYFSRIDEITQLVDLPDAWAADTVCARLRHQYLDALAFAECKEDLVEQFSYAKMKSVLVKYDCYRAAPYRM